jgi:hypothetical protein
MTDMSGFKNQPPIDLDLFKRRADRLMQSVQKTGDARMARVAIHACTEVFENDNPAYIKALGLMNRLPVTIEEFMDGADFLGGAEYDIWPALKDDVIRMNPDVMMGADPVTEVYLGGATGTGKTHTAGATLQYQTYMLTCFKHPQRLFGLTPMTPIVTMLQSVSPSITKRVIYQPLRQSILSMRYFKKYVQSNQHVDSELQLEGNIRIIPAVASIQSLLGQAIASALLDEVNFMDVIENSKKAAGPNGLGGRYDQAADTYSNISRRRKRSFTTKGPSIGCLCIVSSTRYRDDFLDRRIDEAIKFKEPNVLTFRHAQFEVNPKFSDGHKFGTFQIAVGSDLAPTCVIEEGMEAGVHYPASARVIDIPMPYKPDFQKDPDAALRDIVGIATDAISPFIRRRQKINDAVVRGRARALPKLVESDIVILAEDGMPTFIPENFPKTRAEKNKSRWIHVDLSRVNDRCGIAMVRLDGFVNKAVETQNKDKAPILEVLPKFSVELAVGIKPSSTRQIDVAEIRGWILQIAHEYELNIEGISFDGFDSRETIQTLRRSGMNAQMISVDRTTKPYEAVRDALYEDRMDIQPDIELLLTELRTIEYYTNQDIVDHPPNGTKDVSDCVAGATQHAMQSRIVRTGMEIITDGSEVETEEGNTQPARVRVQRDRVRIERERTRR